MHIDRTKTHECGGAILTGGSGEEAHLYCERCGAFAYVEAGDVPSGTDLEANRRARDAGDDRSPSAVSGECV